MAIALKRIMLITRNVQFAIDVKRALEALGEYSVTTVAEVRNAIEQLHDEPQQLILLDVDDLMISPAIMIEMIRSRHEDIALILAPDRPETRALARAYDIQGLVDIPVMARDLLPILEASLPKLGDDLPDTDTSPAVDLGEDTIFIESLVGNFLHEDKALNYTRQRLQASYELLHPTVDSSQESTLQGALEMRLEPEDDGDTVRYRTVSPEEVAASTTLHIQTESGDETPAAPHSESETIRDLAQSLAAESHNEAEALPRAAAPLAAGTDLEDSAAFRQLLNRVLDESTLLEDLTLESLFDTTRELPGALGTGAVNAWLRETEKFINEPSFLQDHLPPIEAVEQLEQTTAPAASPDKPPIADVAEPTSADDRIAEPQSAPPAPEPAGMPLSRRERDPYLAQIAVTITQQMTESTADATVLTRGNRIVAFSGEMALEDFRDLRAAIGDDWSAPSDQSRIRYIQLPRSRGDYMIFSRATDADHSLSMIFGGDKRLREIRRQGERMLSALAAAPGADAPEMAIGSPRGEAEPAADADARQPFVFVWLVSDRTWLLNKSVAEQLVFWLEVQLNSLDWKISRLDVHQDFIYLSADVPGHRPPEQLMRLVMERSRQIARSEDQALPADLWADAYLVLQPGRDMSESELQSFLQFARN